MKTQGAHAHEDRLLDFAYGELPPTEAQLVEQHVHGCSRCSEALDDIRGVRTSMSRLPLESAPDAGLESLLAYAQQSARRAAAGPEPAPRWWRRLLAPALGVAALGVFGIVVVGVDREVDLSPSLSIQQKEAAPPMALAPEPAAAPAPAEVSKQYAQMDKELRAEKPTTRPMPSKAPSKKGIRLREDWSNLGAGSGGGFPDKKAELYSDEESSALDGLATAPAAKSKRDAPGGKALPAASTAQRAEPAPETVVAEAGAAAGYGGPAESEAVQAAPPEPQQMIRGSTSRSASMASKDSADDEAYEQRASGRVQVASAAPPPPPAPVQAQPPAGAAAPVARAEVQESKKSEAAQQSAARRSPSIKELMEQAEVANRSGDWNQEVSFLRAALGAGVQGSQRLEVLSRLCDAEFALGRQQLAIEVCKRVVTEAPGSSAARKAQRRLESELQSPADEANSYPKAAPITK